jgi:tetratricopeptide (TPR) repeat protein
MHTPTPTAAGVGTAPVRTAQTGAPARRNLTLFGAAVIVVAALAVVAGLVLLRSGRERADSSAVKLVDPVEAGEIMVLVGQLEQLNNTNRGMTRFIVQDLKGRLEEDAPFSNLRIREYPDMITSAEQAQKAAEANGAAVVVWGNDDGQLIQVQVEVGVIGDFPHIEIPPDVLDRTANVTAQLTDPRRESLAPQVLMVMETLQFADGDLLGAGTTAAIYDAIDVTSAEVVGNSVAARANRSLLLYMENTEQAIQEIEGAIEIDGRNPLLYVFRALARQRLGQFDLARQDAQTAGELHPGAWSLFPDITEACYKILTRRI